MASLQKSNQQAVFEAISADTGVSVERIQQFMADKGISDPSTLVSDESLLLELMESGKGAAIAPAQPSKPAAKRGGRKPRRTNQQVDFGGAIAHTAAQSAAEIEAFSSTLRQGKEAWVEHTANGILDELRSAPEEVVRTVAELAMEEHADADFFRGEAERLCAGLFAL